MQACIIDFSPLPGTLAPNQLPYLAFFFEHAVVPDAQHSLALLIQLVQLLVGLLPHKLLNETATPFEGAQEITDAFGSGWCMLWGGKIGS